MQGEKPFEVHIGPIHNIEGTRLRRQDIENIDVVQLAIGDMDKSRDIAAQIQQPQLKPAVGLAGVLFEFNSVLQAEA